MTSLPLQFHLLSLSRRQLPRGMKLLTVLDTTLHSPVLGFPHFFCAFQHLAYSRRSIICRLIAWNCPYTFLHLASQFKGPGSRKAALNPQVGYILYSILCTHASWYLPCTAETVHVPSPLIDYY